MQDYNIEQAHKEYDNEIKNNRGEYNEKQQAIIFAKILVKQKEYFKENIIFCGDNELYVSKTPTGYDVVGFYINYQGNKIPFNVTVCKVNELWYPSRRYIAADTKSCSGSIFLWVILTLACALMGILMCYLMSAATGI